MVFAMFWQGQEIKFKRSYKRKMDFQVCFYFYLQRKDEDKMCKQRLKLWYLVPGKSAELMVVLLLELPLTS